MSRISAFSGDRRQGHMAAEPAARNLIAGAPLRRLADRAYCPRQADRSRKPRLRGLYRTRAFRYPFAMARSSSPDRNSAFSPRPPSWAPLGTRIPTTASRRNWHGSLPPIPRVSGRMQGARTGRRRGIRFRSPAGPSRPWRCGSRPRRSVRRRSLTASQTAPFSRSPEVSSRRREP